ncbi:GNAT family N-acetyltransferase [Virgibacillus sp. W0181]|uniref:GNAT family N-acetyltransferase n=1 Tax=Virgibacillus sp. W0181 TaxID=3391581 RepID=UPI003F44CD54
MYELVQTKQQQKQFANTWEYFCKKYNWVNDPYAQEGIRYNLINKSHFRKKQVIGTVEFAPYKPNNPNSTVEAAGKIDFSQYDLLQVMKGHIWEIDKVCIHEDYQRKGYFPTFLRITLDHAKKYGPVYYFGLTEKRLFRMLRMMLGSIVEQYGEALVDSNTTLVPTVVHIEKLMNVIQHIHNYKNNSYIIKGSYSKERHDIIKYFLYFK